jgi:hypothetical protein
VEVERLAVRVERGRHRDDIGEEDRAEIEDVLTRPFGEVDLSGAFNGPGGRTDRPVTRQEKRERRARLKAFRKEMFATGFSQTGFAQSNFLLFKQLLYFERYGKLYLSDVSLVSDRDFFAALIA